MLHRYTSITERGIEFQIEIQKIKLKLNIKSYGGLGRSAAPEVIHIPHIPHLLDIKSISQLYLECHLGARLLLRTRAVTLLSTPILRGMEIGQEGFYFHLLSRYNQQV